MKIPTTLLLLAGCALQVTAAVAYSSPPASVRSTDETSGSAVATDNADLARSQEDDEAVAETAAGPEGSENTPVTPVGTTVASPPGIRCDTSWCIGEEICGPVKRQQRTSPVERRRRSSSNDTSTTTANTVGVQADDPSDDAFNWWRLHKSRFKLCVGCGARIPSKTRTETTNEQLNMKDYRGVLEAARILANTGEKVGPKQAAATQYGDVVFWVCNCGRYRQGWPGSELAAFARALWAQGSRNDHTRPSGWMYINPWHKGFNIASVRAFNEGFRRRHGLCPCF